MIQPMSINMILPCVIGVIGFIVLCVVIYNITDHNAESRENRILALQRVLESREYRKLRAQHNAEWQRNWKEFNRITIGLGIDKRNLLQYYFIVTNNMPLESVNTFLKSYRGMAFLKSYRRCTDSINSIGEFKISELILNAEKEEEIITDAVDILKCKRNPDAVDILKLYS